MVTENGVIFDKDFNSLYWYDLEDATPTYLPDNRNFSEVIWELKDRMYGYAHTHPFGEMLVPSLEDLTSFQGIEQGIGKRLLWPIVTFGGDKIYYFHKKVSLVENEYKNIYPKMNFKQQLNKKRLFDELRRRTKK